MNLVLDLPKDLSDELESEARQLQLPVSEYALRLLATGRTSAMKPQTGAQLVAYWQQSGLVGGRADITDAPAHARELRRQAEQRKRS